MKKTLCKIFTIVISVIMVTGLICAVALADDSSVSGVEVCPEECFVLVETEQGIFEVSPETAAVIEGLDESDNYAKGELLVVYDNVDSATHASIAMSDNGEKTTQTSGNEIIKVTFDENEISMKEKIIELSNEENVIYVQPNYYYSLIDDVDYYDAYEELAEMMTIGIADVVNDPLANGQYYLSQVNMAEAWAVVNEMGTSKVKVAVIDTGVRTDHEDFTNLNTDLCVCTERDYLPYPKQSVDDHGHGSNVTGIIGATANNGLGIAGGATCGTTDVSSRLELFSIDAFTKIKDGNNYKWGAYSDDIYKALVFATDNGAKVISMSLGCTETPSQWLDDVMKKGIDYAYEHGAVCVCAAGNENNNSDYTHTYPSDYERVISVIALKTIYLLGDNAYEYPEKSFTRAYFSNYGHAQDISAPGVYIKSVSHASTDSYDYMSGTSQATPIVSSVIALMFMMDSDLTFEQVYNIITSTATDLAHSTDYNQSDFYKENAVNEFDIYTAYGLINAEKCVKEILGESVSWDFNQITGELTISGTGMMRNYSQNNPAPWSQYAGQITSVIIDNGVNSIGKRAFYDCINLSEITVPNSVSCIGVNAFEGCSNITKITMGSGNKVFDSRDNCNAIIETSTNKLILGCKNTVIPSSVTSIGEYAFSGCIGLTSIEIPTSVTSIGEYAFSGCIGLTSIEIPTSVTNIGNSVFDSCSGLTDLTMPAGKTYDASTFSGCTGITSVTLTGNGPMINYDSNTYQYSPWYISRANNITVTIEEGVTSIGEYAFSDCAGLTSIEIPSGVTSIGENAFGDCSGLTSVKIPSSVISIGNFAFDGCSGLKSIEIPSGVTSIGNSAFRGCSGLTDITMPAGATYDVGTFSGCTGITSVALTGNGPMINYDSNTYQYSPWYISRANNITVTIEEGVTSIGNSAFRGCSGLKSIEIPSGVTSIGNFAFDGCSGLTAMEIPSGVTSIGNFAFRGCKSLESIMVDPGNLIFDSRDNCNAIIETSTNKLIVGCKNTEIPSGVTSIENSAFYGCSGLKSIEIPSGVTSIGNFAFDDCSGLTDITMPAGATYDNYTFGGCTGITSVTLTGNGPMINYDNSTYWYTPWYISRANNITVTIEEGVTSIGNSAFYGCSGLTSIEIPSGVTSIGEIAFYGCSGLKSIEIPEGVTSIESYAFNSCSGLTDLIMPVGATYDDYTFGGCTRITSVTLTGNGPMINYDNETYRYTPWYISRANNITVTIAEGVTSIGEYAFRYCSGLKSMEIPSSVISIGASAFYYCSGLKSIEIPSGVTSIGDYAFRGCNSLESIIVDPGNLIFDSRDNCNAIIETSTNNLIVGCKNTEIPAGVTSIGGYAFNNVTELTSIKIPFGVTRIGEYAFNNCTGLRVVLYGSSLENKRLITIQFGNAPLTSATWYFTPCEHSKTHVNALSPTCIIPGNIEHWTCSTCNRFFLDEACTLEITQAQTVIEVLEHTKEHHAAVAPTCTEDGNIEYWYCTACRKYFSDEICANEITYAQTVIAASGHTMEYHNRWEATFDKEGNLEYWYCTACKKYFTDNEGINETTWEALIIPQMEKPDVTKVFDDVPADAWFADCVAFVYARGIMKGMGGSKNFAPYEPLHREQLAAMLYRLEKSPTTEYAAIFPDVPEGTWYTIPIIWAYEKGIITGYQSGYFGVGDNITREQLAVMLYRYAGNFKHLDVSTKAEISGFTDAASVSDWAYDAISWAVGNGIITGKDGGTRIDPQGNAARCECAAMFQRFMNKYGL